MDDGSPSVRGILKRYNAELCLAFPTADIHKLMAGDSKAKGILHGRIDLYLATIAGYASSADRLKRRSRQDLQVAKEDLSESFFEKYQEYASIRALITPIETPSLFARMETAELLRVDLLKEVERLLTSR